MPDPANPDTHSPGPTAPNTDRPKSRENENEDLKVGRYGEPPRSATEPRGSEGSSDSRHTDTDPASGEPSSR